LGNLALCVFIIHGPRKNVNIGFEADKLAAGPRMGYNGSVDYF
jgi:hypothetical protein